MNLAHLHLVINHVPTIGSVAALGVLLLGYVRRNDHLKHVGLEVLFIVALLTLPVYVTGAASYFEIRARPGVSVDNRRRVLRLIENMTLGRNAVGYLTESMHGAGSPQAQRIQIARLSNLEEKKDLAKRLAGVSDDETKTKK